MKIREEAQLVSTLGIDPRDGPELGPRQLDGRGAQRLDEDLFGISRAARLDYALSDGLAPRGEDARKKRGVLVGLLPLYFLP
jgi:hypothetical protein